ncbi:MAG: replication-relaxation family protein [Ardenticatenaceae bacterium]|nr:replication-relaxation family protein [Ardenticatenaceae bacterium]
MPDTAQQIRERDIAIFWAIYACQALSTPQINARFFPPETSERKRDVRANQEVSSRCRTRLKQLYQAGYLTRQEIPTTTRQGKLPLLYFLTPKAVKLLAKEAGVTLSEMDWRPEHNEIGFNKLDHLVHLNDVRLSLGIAAEAAGYEITKWLNERELQRLKMKAAVPNKKGRKRREALIPDAFFTLLNPSQVEVKRFAYPYFLEVDRGSEHIGLSSDKGYLNYFKSKIPRYLSYYRSGAYTAAFEFEQMQVLIVTTDMVRLQKMKEAIEVSGGGRQFWLTTQEQLTTPYQALTHPIWHVAQQNGPYPLVH